MYMSEPQQLSDLLSEIRSFDSFLPCAYKKNKKSGTLLLTYYCGILESHKLTTGENAKLVGIP